MKISIMYHAGCADGLASAAIVAHNVRGDNVQLVYVPMNYRTPANTELIAGSDVIYMVDLAMGSLEAVLTILKCTKKMVWIDHHKSSEALLDSDDEGWVLKAYSRQPNEDRPKLEIIFDVNHSAAVLTFKYFHKRTDRHYEVPLLVEDRDLWKFDIPGSEAMSYGFRLIPSTVDAWERLIYLGYPKRHEVLSNGLAIEKHINDVVEALIKHADLRKVQFGNFGFDAIPLVNSAIYSSEIGHELCKKYPECPFAAVYRIYDSKVTFELRSMQVDVAEIAQAMGGGGHRSAAGFTIPLESLSLFVHRL